MACSLGVKSRVPTPLWSQSVVHRFGMLVGQMEMT